MDKKRIIFHVDCDYFFAQAEEVRNPDLKETPVVVCVYSGRTVDSGAVGTANYHARKLGIHSGMPIFLAKKKANKETIFLPVDMKYYAGISEKIMSILKSFSNKFEKTSVDEAFIEVTQKCDGDYSKAKNLALKVKKKIFDEVKITVSVGIGSNKLIAKIASSRQKPNGLTLVTESEVKSFLSDLPVTEIPGIGKKTSIELEGIKVKTIKELSLVLVPHLIDLFGETKGTYLHNSSLGVDNRDLEEGKEKKRLSVIRTMKSDCKSVNEMAGFLEEISRELSLRVLSGKVFFKTVNIVAIDSKLETFTRAKTLDKSSNSFEDILFTAKSLFQAFFEEKKGIILRRGGVGVTNFSTELKQRTLGDF